MTTITPGRTDEQRLAALDQANRIRSSRAHLKRCLRTDPEDARRVIAAPTADYRTMRLRDLLVALPHMGPSRVDYWMRMERISPLKTLAGLTYRQREAALEFVSEYLGRRAAA